jgi:GTP-binding protein EngB required for normal cell division
MKIVLIMLIVMVGSMTASYFAGKHSANNTHYIIKDARNTLQSEHADILRSIDDTKNGMVYMNSKLDKIESKVNSKLDKIESKLDILVKMAISSSPYLNDTKLN